MLKSRRVIASTLLAVSLSVGASHVIAGGDFDILRSYYEFDGHIPPDIQFEEAQQGTEIITDFTFVSFDNELVWARLERPDPTRFPGKRPVVILLHGITQSLEQWWRLDQEAYSFPSAHREVLVRNGFAVLAIDLRNHGNRIQQHDFPTPSVYLQKGYYEAIRKMIAQSAIDVRRTIDIVEHFDGLDDKRVSVVGFSLGAWAGYLATAVDDGVSSAVFIGLPFLPPTEGHQTHFISQYEYSSGMAGRPVHFVAGTQDSFHTREHVEDLIEAIGPEASVSWVESGHDFPRSTADMTLRHLQGQPQ